ncbi:MAG: carbohydrate-binding family 9-like protein [Armatimonadota bacterium]|nr:carbohydrate-binding family 9-like protein [Armatimonadota bacterium]
MLVAIMVAATLTAAHCAAQEPEVRSTALSGPPPVIDGRLDEDVWQDAGVADGFTLLGNPQATPAQTTRVRITHDDATLFVAWECAEDTMDEIVGTMTEHDAPVWSEDCVELFVSPAHDGSGYYHLLVNPLGTLRDERGKEETWESNARAAATREDDRWLVELALPLASMQLPPGVDEHWRMNFTRHRLPREELSTWAPLPGENFHQPEQFGHLRGLDADFAPLLRAQALQRVAHVQAELAALRREALPHEEIALGRVALGRAQRLSGDAGELAATLRAEPETEETPTLVTQVDQLREEAQRLARLVARLPLAAAAGTRGYVISQASTMQKIPPDAAFAGQPAQSVEIALAANEREAAQVVIVPAGRALQEVAVSVSDLSGPAGATIPAGEIEVTRAAYVTVTQSTSKAPLGPGRLPDPLVAAEPFDVPEGEVRSVWLTVHTAADQPAGTYRGTITIDPSDAEPLQVPLTARVWDFALPRTPWLRTCYGLGFNVSSFYPNVNPGPGRPPQWNAGAWTGADVEGRPNYFGDMEFTAAFDQEHRHGGRNSVRVTITHAERGTHEAPRFCYYTDPMPLEPGGEYIFELWYRTAPGEDTRAAWWMPEGGAGDLPPTDGEWRQASARFTMGEAENTRLYLRTFEVGSVWFDDARLSPADDPERNLLPNPGFEMGQFTPDSIMRAYRDNCLLHRCSPEGMGSPRISTAEDGTISIDWSEFDAGIERAIDLGLTAFNIRWCRLPSGWGTVEGWEEEPTPEQRRQIQRATELLQRTEAHLAERDWHRLGYIYTIDEPGAKAFDAVKQAFGLVDEVAPKLKTLLTYGYGASRPIEPGNPRYAELAGFVDIHVPHSDCFEPIYLEQRRQAGDEIWAYVCISAQRPWLNNWAIDYPGTDHRILFWQLFQHEITGFLYWRITYWQEDPWENPMTYPGGNGDGSLIYPGEDGPVSSIRWELNRDGVEDYDMLAMLSAAADELEARGERAAAERARAALGFPAVTTDWTEYTQDPSVVAAHRQGVAAALEDALRRLGRRSIEPPHSIDR